MSIAESATPARVIAQFPMPIHEPADFSIVRGGALYQLLLRTRLAGPELELFARRGMAPSAVGWLPLLLLSMIAGRAWSGVKTPFLLDFDVQVRFLVSLPLLLYGEKLAHQRIRTIIAQFFARKIISTEQRPRFESIVNSSLRLRDSVVIEVVLLVFVMTVGHWIWRGQIARHISTWYGDSEHGGLHLTLPGAYFAFVSIPLFQFILLRWYVRLLIWLQLPWRISRLDLHLVPTHPDGMGGTSDIQSLADLSNSYDVICGMQPFAFGRSTVIRLAVATLLPIAPLVLTMIPFEQLLDRLLKTLL